MLVAAAKQGINLNHILSISGVVLVITAAVGMVLAYLRTSLTKSTIELQNEQITAQSQRIASLEDELERSKRDSQELRAKILVLEANIVSLERIKTSSDELNIINIDLKRLSEISERQSSKIISLLESKIVSLLEENTRLLQGLHI